MPPRSLEQSSTNYEQNKKELPQYLDIERGDTTPVDPSQSSSQNNQNDTTAQQSTSQQQTKKQIDPVEFFKSIISTGPTPTQAQISNVKANLSGQKDSSETWLAFLLEKLWRQEQIKRKNAENNRR